MQGGCKVAARWMREDINGRGTVVDVQVLEYVRYKPPKRRVPMLSSASGKKRYKVYIAGSSSFASFTLRSRLPSSLSSLRHIYRPHSSLFTLHPSPSPAIYCCCFFCALGPISLLKAKYDTSRLVRARTPTSRIRNRGMTAMNPINNPGVKYW
jgi:hypothetical protein